MSIGETLFRQGLSADGEMFVVEMMEDCPGGFSPFFTDKSRQLRVRLNAGHQRRLLVLTPNGTGFLCKTLAGVEACRAIGIDAKPCSPGETVMTSSFWLDPAVHRPATLFAVLGAATQNLARAL